MNISDLNHLPSPCFVLDKAELEQNIIGFHKALEVNFNKSAVGYSIKTNSTPFCLSIAKTLGAYAEVVSHDEYKLARACGFMIDRIIYNGPMKSKYTFLEAVKGGAIVNIETKRELDWLKELPKDSIYKVGLRLNINISHVSPEDADGNNDNSRFGFSDETGEFKAAIECINQQPNLILAGLHIHRTAHSRSIRFYRQSIKFACETITKHSLQLEYLDVGGGFFGIFPNKPTYQEYSDAFHQILKKHGLDYLCLIVEPGNALVASCFEFISEVIDVKQVEKDLWFVTTDGSRNDIDPFFKKNDYIKEIIYFKNNDVVKKQVIGGCTCLEYDRMFTLVDMPRLSVGDRIYYKNVGAYTMCLTPMFIRYIPKIYMKTADDFELIRESYSADDYIRKSKL